MSNLPPKAVSTFAAAGLLLAGSAPAASAETLHRNGASTVTIRPAGAPAGAKVSTAAVRRGNDVFIGAPEGGGVGCGKDGSGAGAAGGVRPRRTAAA